MVDVHGSGTRAISLDPDVGSCTNAAITSSTTQQQSKFLNDVRATVESNKDATFVTWYNGNGKPTDDRTFGQIWEKAGVISHCLRCKLKIQKGQRVVLCYDFGLHFFEVFFGCLRAGVVAVLGK